MASKKPSKAKAQGPVDTAFNNTDSGPGAPPAGAATPAMRRAAAVAETVEIGRAHV